MSKNIRKCKRAYEAPGLLISILTTFTLPVFNLAVVKESIPALIGAAILLVSATATVFIEARFATKEAKKEVGATETSEETASIATTAVIGHACVALVAWRIVYGTNCKNILIIILATCLVSIIFFKGAITFLEIVEYLAVRRFQKESKKRRRYQELLENPPDRTLHKRIREDDNDLINLSYLEDTYYFK